MRPQGHPRPLWVALGLALIFGFYLFQVTTNGLLVQLDHHVQQALNDLRVPSLFPVFHAFSWLGGFSITLGVCLIASLWLGGRRQWEPIPGLWLTFLGTLISFTTIKWLIGRARPEPLAGIVENSASFPSGSTALAAALYGFLAFILCRYRPNQRFVWVALAFCLAALVAISRLYLSVHYLSDVVAAIALGGFWCCVGIILTQHRTGRS